jgi:F0F1-type ATP synthase delta subunit
MKYRPEMYAQAFLGALEDAPKKDARALLSRFVSTVSRHGDSVRFPQIVKELERELVRRAGGRMIRVTSARKLSSAWKSRFQKYFTSQDHVELAEDPQLVAGITIEVDGEYEMDASLRRKLKLLFS